MAADNVGPIDCALSSSYAAILAPGLLDPDYATPASLVGQRGKRAVKRYNAYRNNVTVSLIDALAAIFPATHRITGTVFFRTMARFYVRAVPPRSPLLFEYGHDFPDFIARYEHARGMPICRTRRASNGPGSMRTTLPTRNHCRRRRWR